MDWLDSLGKIGKVALSFIPGGGAAVAAIEGIEAVANMYGGDTGKKVAEGVALVREGLQEMQPEKLTGKERLALEKERNRHEEHIRDAALQEKRLELNADEKGAAQTTDRAAKLEGTAEDLKALPVVGRIIIFMRGCQRPLWGYATLLMDWMLFSKQWALELHNPNGTSTIEGIIVLVINFLVLTFLFGERAVKNILPFVIGFLDKRAAKVRG